jgi:hypothetical protein
MGSTENINKKLLIAIFTIPFLIGFIYSVYSQATSAQDNAAISSLESNSIIQWIINSSISGYSTAGQSLASFLSINGIPSYVWTIITFLMATLFFIAIYIFLFEIFIQRAKISENETMRKAKILFIFTLSIFSAIAIGYAIPFLLNLYGLILLILLLIALFFFGRAAISYGKSFHYATKSLAVNVEKDLVNLEKELKEAKKYLPQEDVKSLTEGIEKIRSIYNEAKNVREAADEKFKNILSELSKLIDRYKTFTNSLISGYHNFLNKSKKNKRLTPNKIQILENFIKQVKKYINTDKQKLQNIENKLNNILSNSNPDIQQIQSIIQEIGKIENDMLRIIGGLIAQLSINDKVKDKLHNILNKAHDNTLSQYKKQILSEIQTAIEAYRSSEEKLNTLYAYKKSLNDIGLRIRKSLGVHGNRKAEIGMSYEIEKLEKDIEISRNSIIERINFLENLEKLLH